MPKNLKHYAHESTISLGIDMLGSWTKELVAYNKKYALWYGLVHETGLGGKLHVHVATIYEILVSTSPDEHEGGQTISNHIAKMRRHCPTLNDYLTAHPSKYSIVSSAMKSDHWISCYMNKELKSNQELVYSDLPLDTKELQRYFSDLQAKKLLNPELIAWAKIYRSTSFPAPMPSTPHDCYLFFKHHGHVVGDINRMSEIVRKNNSLALSEHLNGEVSLETPFKKPVKASTFQHIPDWDERCSQDSTSTLRLCPRCYSPGNDPSKHLVEKNHIYCSDCVKH